jgi:hypothetical protein
MCITLIIVIDKTYISPRQQKIYFHKLNVMVMEMMVPGQ